jgi:multimeric flavodoxin WrbA
VKLLSLVGSPRKGRNTDTLADQAGRSYSEAGGAVEKLYLADLDIRPCRGCYACMEGEGLDSVCVQQDDMTEVYGKLLGADALLWGTPVYMWSPTAQMKLFLDRLFPFGDYQTTRWRCALAGKPVGLIIVYADPDPLKSGVFHTHAILDIVARASGGTVAGVVHSAVNDKGTLGDDHPLMVRAAELGCKLAEEAEKWKATRHGAG